MATKYPYHRLRNDGDSFDVKCGSSDEAARLRPTFYTYARRNKVKLSLKYDSGAGVMKITLLESRKAIALVECGIKDMQHNYQKALTIGFPASVTKLHGDDSQIAVLTFLCEGHIGYDFYSIIIPWRINEYYMQFITNNEMGNIPVYAWKCEMAMADFDGIREVEWPYKTFSDSRIEELKSLMPSLLDGTFKE